MTTQNSHNMGDIKKKEIVTRSSGGWGDTLHCHKNEEKQNLNGGTRLSWVKSLEGALSLAEPPG
jgi:hypothetical protein